MSTGSRGGGSGGAGEPGRAARDPAGCVLALDLDGVLVHPRADLTGGWSSRLAADLGIDPGALGSRFFDTYWPEVIVGQRDLKEALAAVLPGLHPGVTADQLIEYWFSHDARLDQDVLAEAQDWKKRTGGRCIAATNQEQYRMAFLQAQTGLGDLFDGLFWSGDLGLTKADPGFFGRAAARLNIAADRIWFFDDDRRNVAMAASAGWRAFPFVSAVQLREVLEADFPR
jgi:putative hydrolase of the HAD superfamily